MSNYNPFNQPQYDNRGGGPPWRRGQPIQYAAPYAGQMSNATVASFFNAVYGWMAAGLGVTAVVAYWVSTRPDVVRTLGMPGLLILFVAQMVLAYTIGAAINRISAGVATVLFMVFSALMGVSLSGLFYAYTLDTLAGAFVASAAMFGAMSVFGFVTRKDLSGWGSFLFMALIGLIVASIVNVFLHSGAMAMLLSYAGVAIFAGLTAYDTQKLKAFAYQAGGDAALMARISVSGALMLYLDFINIFVFLVQIMGAGDRRR